MHGWRAFAPVQIHLSGVRICQHYSLYLSCNGAVLCQVGAHDAKRNRPGGIWSEYKLRGTHTGFRRKALLNPFTQPELQTIPILLIGSQDNDFREIGIRKFWIVGKEEAR